MKRNLQKKNKKNRERIKEIKKTFRRTQQIAKRRNIYNWEAYGSNRIENKVSEDSNLNEEFMNIELNYQSLIAKRNELFKNMALLDKNVNVKEQPKKHEDTYVDAYNNYLAYTKERIEAKDKENREDQYQTLYATKRKLRT